MPTSRSRRTTRRACTSSTARARSWSLLILVAAIGANVWFNLRDPAMLDHFPVIGAAVVLAILVTAPLRKPDWSLLPGAFKGSVFLLALVLVRVADAGASSCPRASWQTALGLGFLSAVFDNIPLTALAHPPGRLRLGLPGLRGRLRRLDDLVRLVGRRGAVEHVPRGALGRRLAARRGWHVAVGYVVGFFVMLAVLGWHPAIRSTNARLRQPRPLEGVAKCTTRPAVLVARAVFAEVVERLRVHFEVEANPADAHLHQRRADRSGCRARPAPSSPAASASTPRCWTPTRSCARCATWRWATTTSTSPACTARGVLVTNTPDVLTETTADFGFALMMATARRMAESEHFLRARRVDAAGPTTCSPAPTCTARRSASSAWAASARRSRGAARWASACR